MTSADLPGPAAAPAPALPPLSRRVLALALPVAAGAAGVVAWPLAGDRLPDRVATHWGLSGAPNGASALNVAAAIFAFGIALAAVVAAAALVARRRPRPEAPPAASAGVILGAFLAGLLGALSVATVLANLDAARWQDADLPLLVLPAAPALAVACGALAAWATAPRLADDSGAGAGAGVLRGPAPAPPAARIAWTGTAHARWAWLTAACAAAGAVAVVRVAPVVALTLAVVAVSVGFIASLRVTIGVHGIRVRAGLTPWPSVHLPLTAIAAAGAVDVRPREWGGWGYRGSLRLSRRAAWVLRRGPGLRVDLCDGRTFVVTVDDPEEGAAALAAALTAC
jgi:hypothetical protein